VPQIADARRRVDDIIGEIRDYVVADPGGGQPSGAPLNGSR
jgi:hypothetical protein